MLNREYLYFNCDCNMMIDRLLCIVQISYKEIRINISSKEIIFNLFQ